MKSIIIGVICVILVFTVIGCVGVENGDTVTNKETTAEKVSVDTTADNSLGEYDLVIDSCRIAKDYDGKPVAIVKYIFTNNDDEAVAFSWTFDDAVYQNGIGLNKTYFVSDDVEYSEDNQYKEIKTGATIEVEVAYELNDNTSDLEVEVGKLISFSDKKITKTFTIA